MSDLDALKEAYPVSEDVARLNADHIADTSKMVATSLTHKDNPALKVIDNPEKLRKLQKAVGIKESEDDFLCWIIALAQYQGWLVAHFRPARTDKGWRTATQGNAGFPDLVLARAGVAIFIEAKSEIGTLSPPQEAWQEALKGDGVATELCFVFRPSDRNTIIKLLA